MYLSFDYLKSVLDVISYVGGLLAAFIFVTTIVKSIREHSKGANT